MKVPPRSNQPPGAAVNRGGVPAGADRGRESFAFARRVLIATLVVASVVLLLYFVWYAADLLMLVFAGVLVSILLRGVSRFLRQKTGLGRGLALGIVVLGLLVLFVIGAWLLVVRIGSQWDALRQQLPQAVESLRRYVAQYEWAREAVAGLPDINDWLTNRSGTIVSRITGLASTTFGTLVNVVVVLVIGLYLASQPELYSNGIKHVLPLRHRERVGEVLGTIDEALWRWLGGRALLMTLNGALTAAGLWLLGVPLALTLGVLCGLLNFIPNFGPWIAAVPAVLIAFLQSPPQALYTLLLYVLLQGLDGYVFTPIVDRKSVELPPVLTITAQVLLGLVFGFIGLLLASPLAATLLILVKTFYVEDVLGDHTMRQGGEAGGEERGEEPDGHTVNA